MKKHMAIFAAIIFTIVLMPYQSEANPRFGNKNHQRGNTVKHEKFKHMQHARNMEAHRFQLEKIQALKSMAKADGRITRKERTIIKYEERKTFGNHAEKRDRKGSFARR